MEILTAAQMRSVDRRAIETMGLPGFVLMESAGRGVAERLLADEPDLLRRTVAILCGRGNNGGDGIACGRHLLRWGVRPRIALLARGDELRGEAGEHYRAARAAGLAIDEMPDEVAWRSASILDGADLVVDALLGTGAHGGARGLVATAIEDLARSGRPVVSIDLPSGVDGDRGEIIEPVVRAKRTYTLCRPKLALVLEPAASCAGAWTVVPIGIPDAAVAAERAALEWLDAAAVRGALPRRPVAAHKGTFGHVLVVAGSRDKPGAAVLAARAALRSGAGLVSVATPRSAQGSVAAQQAEIMTEGLPETRGGGLSKASPTRALRLLGTRDALALGPGLGTEAATRDAILTIVRGNLAPAVLDADALNAFAASARARRELRARGRAMVLTPHPGEMARLLGSTTAAVQADRSGAARRLADGTQAVVVLKGHRTIVAAPDGSLSFNASGNPGMATAGVGDVLTGVVAALLARGLTARQAARLAVWVHGDAGDRAAARLGPDGMIASDLLDDLPCAIAAVAEH